MRDFEEDFARIFDDHQHDCPIQKAVESGKRPIAAASRFTALDKLAATTRTAETNKGNGNV
jgi:hypothetical protein